MIRKIIHIDEEKCNGCGLCAEACHEGAIEIIEGKAKLMREDFCDGLGDCLPNCPMGAITFEEREAPAYDETAVMESKKQKMTEQQMTEQQMAEQKMSGQSNTEQAASRQMTLGQKIQEQKMAEAKVTGQTFEMKTMEGKKMADEKQMNQAAGHVCPGSQTVTFDRSAEAEQAPAAGYGKPVSRLNQWPCQIKLVPVQAPFFDGAKLLIAADCTAFAYASMHEDFMKGKITLNGCPKLDDVDYSEKLTEIIRRNDIKSVTIVRMEVPCCGGLQRAAETALKNSGKFIPWQVVTISRDGRILD